MNGGLDSNCNNHKDMISVINEIMLWKAVDEERGRNIKQDVGDLREDIKKLFSCMSDIKLHITRDLVMKKDIENIFADKASLNKLENRLGKLQEDFKIHQEKHEQNLWKIGGMLLTANLATIGFLQWLFGFLAN